MDLSRDLDAVKANGGLAVLTVSTAHGSLKKALVSVLHNRHSYDSYQCDSHSVSLCREHEVRVRDDGRVANLALPALPANANVLVLVGQVDSTVKVEVLDDADCGAKMPLGAARGSLVWVVTTNLSDLK